MAHSENAYAALIVDGFVYDVIAIPYCNDDDAQITTYCNEIGLLGTWIDTSYTGSRRGKYAAIGDRYDEQSDRFIPADWNLVNGAWVAPNHDQPLPEPWVLVDGEWVDPN